MERRRLSGPPKCQFPLWLRPLLPPSEPSLAFCSPASLPPAFLSYYETRKHRRWRKAGDPDPLFILTSWLHALLPMRASSRPCVCCTFLALHRSFLPVLWPSAFTQTSAGFPDLQLKSAAFPPADPLLRRQPFLTHFLHQRGGEKWWMSPQPARIIAGTSQSS